jgi:hypothetical protein
MLMRCVDKTQEKELKAKLLLNIHLILTCVLHILYQLASFLCNFGSSFAACFSSKIRDSHLISLSQ